MKRRVRRRLRKSASVPVRRTAPAGTRAHRAEAKTQIDGGVKIGGAKDPAETAADRMAARVLSGNPGPVAPVSRTAFVARACAGCEREANRNAVGAEEVSRSARPTAIAPGATSAPAPRAAAKAIASLGGGRPLSKAERRFFEPRFKRGFGHVRLHTDTRADQAAAAIDARAFAFGPDIAFARGEFARGGRSLLAHELAHVALASPDEPLHRELCRQPPGRVADPPELTDAERTDAASFNTQRFNADSTETILDLMGAAGRRNFLSETSDDVQQWQAEFRLNPDGKVGLRTLETLCREMIACGLRNPVINLIIDGHNFSLANVRRIWFDRTLTDANASTGPLSWGHRPNIRVGPPGFAQGYRGLVHTIRHEIEHAAVIRGSNVFVPVAPDEFRAETVEIVSRGMLLESYSGMIDDAGRAIDFWDQMSAAERREAANRFRAARDEINRRTDARAAVTPAQQAIVDRWNAVAL